MIGVTGAGLYPAGLEFAGIGVPVGPVAQGGSVFRNVDTSSTAVQLQGRKIDPVLRQYVFDSYGRIVGMSTVQQLVLLAWSTTKGLSALSTLGQELRSIDVIGPDIQRKISTLLTAAVQTYIDQGLMVILSIDVSRVNQSGEYVVIRWRDLTTNTDQTTQQPL